MSELFRPPPLRTSLNLCVPLPVLFTRRGSSSAIMKKKEERGGYTLAVLQETINKSRSNEENGEKISWNERRGIIILL